MHKPKDYKTIPLGMPFVITKSVNARYAHLVGTVAPLKQPAEDGGVVLHMPNDTQDMSYWYWEEVEIGSSGIAALYGYDVKDMTP